MSTNSIKTDAMNDPLWVETPFRLQELQSDSELLEVYVQSGRRWAAEALIRRHAGMVAGVIRRLISHRSDAEDAFQATFLIMLKSAQKIRKTKSLASWLYGVAYRTALRVRSQSHKRRASGMEVQEVEAHVEESDPRSILARKLELDSLDEELQELPASLREPLVEHYLLGRTAAEIADRMDVSLTAVEGRLKRGRRMLRRRLAIRGVSLSVVLAGAAWFQKQACAMEASEWLDKLFDAPVFQSSDPSGLEGISDPTDPTLLDPQLIDSTIAHQNLSHLVQGELIVRKMMIGKLIGSTCLTLAAIGGISYATYPLQFGGPGINTGSSEVSITGSDTTDETPEFVAQKPPRSKPRGQESGTPQRGSTAGNPGGDASGGADGGGSGSGGGVIAGSGSGTAGEMGSSGMGSGGMISGSGMPGAAPGSGGRSGGTPGMGPGMGMPGMSGAPGSDGMAGGATDNTSSKFVVPEGPIPDWLASGQKEREACEAIRTQLRKKTNFVFEDVPLETALEQISKELGTPIIMNSYVQSQNLENVNYKGPDLPTRLTLRMILEGNNLAYVVKSDCIEIQIQGDAESCSMRFYDLAYVIDSADQTRAIVQVIQSQVAEDVWLNTDGTSSISTIGSIMIATCPEVVHEGIERFLGEISKANPSNLKARSGQAADQGGGGGVGFGGGGGGFGGGGMGGGMF